MPAAGLATCALEGVTAMKRHSRIAGGFASLKRTHTSIRSRRRITSKLAVLGRVEPTRDRWWSLVVGPGLVIVRSDEGQTDRSRCTT